MDGRPLAERIRARGRRGGARARRDRARDGPRRRGPGVDIYMRLKHQAAAEVGIASVDRKLPQTTEEELLEQVAELNADDAIDGILVQLPLPEHIDEARVIARSRPGEGRRRLPPVQRRPALPRASDACARDAARGDGSARGVQRPARRRPRSRGRPQRRSSASPSRSCCCRRTRRSRSAIRGPTTSARYTLRGGRPRRRGGRAGGCRPRTWSSGATVVDVGMNRTEDGIVGDVDPDAATRAASSRRFPAASGR